jgi:N-acetylglucosaminyldiphosphoundecaprenol N-acetyl-beta-D-mannosaminyltransferase
MGMKETKILGVGFNRLTMADALEEISTYMIQDKPHLIVTANPEMVMLAKDDQLLEEIMERADLVVADGIGVVWASRILGQSVPERIPGIELAEGLLRRANEQGWRVFLLGGAEGVAKQAAQSLKDTMPQLQIVGTYHGYFQTGSEEQALIHQIKQANPHLLLVALGVPRQEKWLAAHLGALKVPVAIGVGGSFNVWAGVDQRAPLWMRKIHLEWFYRLVKQPWRIKRMAVLPKFVGTVWLTRLRKGR